MVISMLVKTETGTEGEFNAASNGKAKVAYEVNTFVFKK